MHTFQSDDTTFHYNSDLSGNVTITDDLSKLAVAVPGSALLDFAAEFIRREKINRLEQASPMQVLMGDV